MKAAYPSWRLRTLLGECRRANKDLTNGAKDHGAKDHGAKDHGAIIHGIVVQAGKETGEGRPQDRETSELQAQSWPCWRFPKDFAVSRIVVCRLGCNDGPRFRHSANVVK